MFDTTGTRTSDAERIVAGLTHCALNIKHEQYASKNSMDMPLIFVIKRDIYFGIGLSGPGWIGPRGCDDACNYCEAM